MSEPVPGAHAPPDMLDRSLGILSAIPLALIVVLTFADVFARYIFSAPIRGSIEIIEYAMAMAIFTALPLVTRSRGHVSVSLIDGMIKGGVRRAKTVLCDLISAFALGLTTWRLGVQAIEDFKADSATLVLAWPHAPLYFAMAALCATATVVMLRLAWLSLGCPEDRP